MAAVKTWNDYVAMHTTGVRIKGGLGGRGGRRGPRRRRRLRRRVASRPHLKRILYWLP